MNPIRKRKLSLVLLLLSGLFVVIGLVTYALRYNISLFFTPEQIVKGEVPLHQTIRMGGMVVANSLHHSKHSLVVRFHVTDYKQTITVMYNGILPDLFRAGQGVVVKGQYDPTKGQFNAVEVLAKHDEKYMPPEVKQAIDKNRPSQVVH